jgi:hypothetical protein
MQTAHVSTATLGEHRGYGYGLSVSSVVSVGGRYYETPLVEHDGEIAGYSAQFMLLPEHDFGFVLFSNRSDAPRFPNTVTALLGLAGLSAEIPAPVELDPAPERFQEYAGTYEDEFLAGTVVVAAQDGRVTLTSSALDAAGIPYEQELRATTLHNFVFMLQGREIPVTFIANEAGHFTWLRARHFVARRI